MESPNESCSRQTKASNLEKTKSSSSCSYEEDFFQFDASELSKSVPNSSNRDAQLNSEVDVGRGDPMLTGSPLAPDAIGVTQSPPNQVMGKSDEAKPYRIPSSVFARSKSTTPMEWSVASNESLFSIHVGNSSFSKDNVFLGRSGELSNLPSPSEPLSPSLTLDNSSRKKLGLGEDLEQPVATKAANAETMKEVLRAAANEHVKEGAQPGELGHHSASLSPRSDGSVNSTMSFAFPILSEGRNVSVKMNPEQQLLEKPHQQQQQQSQPQACETTPNAMGTRWFPCLSCCPFGC